jgi:hypothetical protein
MGPGRDGFSLDALLPLAAAILYAVAGVTSRLLDDDVPSALVNLHSSSIAAIGALALALATGGFTPVASWADWAGSWRWGCSAARRCCASSWPTA